MKIRKILIIASIILLSLVCLIFLYNWSLMRRGQMFLVSSKLSIDKSRMTDKEITLLRRYFTLSQQDDLDELNKMLLIKPEDISLSINFVQQRSDRSQKYIDIEIKNASKRDIILLPLEITRLSTPYEYDGRKLIDYGINEKMFDVTYLKLLEKDDSVIETMELKDLPTKVTHVVFTFAVPTFISKDKKRIETYRKTIKTLTVPVI